MTQFRLLDLFCGAGGSARGYQRAGFYVVGVDNRPMPRYAGDEFILGDALDYCAAHGREYDAIHASPPCQKYSVMTKGRWRDRIAQHPDFIRTMREILKWSGKSYIIENVGGARSILVNPVMLCGSMFGLQTRNGSQLRRHRFFELSFGFVLSPACRHDRGSVVGVYGGGQNPARKHPATIGVWGHSGGASARDGLIQFGINDRRQAMDIDWMTGNELSEAIPPAYTEYIGRFLRAHLEAVRA